MNNILIRVYDDFSHAENARNDLLQAGFDAARIQLKARDDESVPVQGNFYVGDSVDSGRDEQHRRGLGEFLKSLIDSDKDDYNGTFRYTAQSANYMLTVNVDNEQEAATACEITARHGALPTDNGSCSDTTP